MTNAQPKMILQQALTPRQAGMTLVEVTLMSVLSTLIVAMFFIISTTTSSALDTVYGFGRLHIGESLLITNLQQDANDTISAEDLVTVGGVTYQEDLTSTDNNQATLILRTRSTQLNASGGIESIPDQYDYLIYRFANYNATTGTGELQRIVAPNTLGSLRVPQTHVVTRDLSSLQWSFATNERRELTAALQFKRLEGGREFRTTQNRLFTFRNWGT